MPDVQSLLPKASFLGSLSNWWLHRKFPLWHMFLKCHFIVWVLSNAILIPPLYTLSSSWCQNTIHNPIPLGLIQPLIFSSFSNYLQTKANILLFPYLLEFSAAYNSIIDSILLLGIAGCPCLPPLRKHYFSLHIKDDIYPSMTLTVS